MTAGVETMLALEPDPAKRHATQEALQAGHRYVRAALAGQVSPGLAEAYRRADEQVLSTIRTMVGLDQVRFAGCGAAPVAREVLEFMLALGIPVIEVWGMSECAGVPITNLPGANKIGTVGKPIPGVELRLAADGELLLRGPMVMRGYRHDPTATAQAIDPGGWLHTGDLATIDADGYVTIIGARKN
jgi:long-subunit acyl-CoA synthetase (AMP-forming)